MPDGIEHPDGIGGAGSGIGELGIGGVQEGLGRQPNFLQKLFNFLALDPHPYPDVIYWAADSKQLVIARPDELAKNVLPILFKHDKVSSFGRQLNIYGFARVYPGRQFKDANGNVLDASVWAHPTLRRTSSAAEVAAVKRRAAPKLFRTRRLANGTVVRTRAGPEVARKFREIKEDMAIEKRIKQGWVAPSRPTPIPQQAQSVASDLSSIVTAEHFQPHDVLDIVPDGFEWESSSAAEWTPNGNIAMLSVDQLDQMESFEFPPAAEEFKTEDHYRQPLSSIPEGRDMSPERLQYTHEYSYTAHPHQLQVAVDSLHPLPMVTDSFPPPNGRFYRSCPASIHTSPVLAPASLQVPRQFPPSFTAQPMVNDPRHNAIQLRVDTHMPPPMRIAAPAAVNPFTIPLQSQDIPPVNQYDVSPLTPEPQLLERRKYSLPYTPQNAYHRMSIDVSPSEGMSREGSVYAEGQSWERTGIIDPRWVSPKGSAWNTPAATPRSGSPVAQVFPESQMPRGMPSGDVPSGSLGYTERPEWERAMGSMGPPPIPQSVPVTTQWMT